MIHKVSVRASEFQSHSKAANDVLLSPEEDSAEIVKEVLTSIENENTAPVGSNDADWGEW